MVIILFISELSCQKNSTKVKVSEKKEIITTYPFFDPDPIPIFARSSIWGAGSRIYPYFVFNGFSSELREKEWTVIGLKNKFIEVSVLPEVGGKIWGALDLTTGKDFLYTNRVLKFREVALRGPWSSGGIEFNFGVIGHSPSTATPVDYVIGNNPDGSISCTVGNYDWPSRTRWRVTVTVYPGRVYFETRSRWINASPFQQSYYSWMCAAIKTSDDLKYIFPGKYQIGHDYSLPLEPWPVDREGRDLSWYRNNASGGSKSYFVVGAYENFYGAYYQKSDFGFGHWALYPDMPGKKIWIWDLSRAGEIWVDLLTDSNGQYTEPQAGRLLNQSDHGTFSPFASESWKELWFPYSGIGEMVNASPHAVLSLSKKDSSYELGIYALESLDDDLVVEEGKKEIYRRHLKLQPAKKIVVRLDEPFDPEKTTIRMGQKIIHQMSPAKKDLRRPFKFYLPASDSPEELFLTGRTLENEREYISALEKYLACLKKEPNHLGALCRTAELYCRRGELQIGLNYATRALELSMYDPEANFIYGLITRRLGLQTEAREAFGWASRSAAYAQAAYIQLAEISLAEKDYLLAEEYAMRAVTADQKNPIPYELLAAVLRLRGKKAEARKTCQKILTLDPIDHIARYELYLLEPSEKNLEIFKSFIKNEFPDQTYLELALYYQRIGEAEKAIHLLSLAPENAETLSWLAYLSEYYDFKNRNIFLEKAASASPYLVFPFREESIPVFLWASSKKPDCWKFRYYLGLIYWHKGRIEDAREMFKTLDSADYYPVFIARACLNQLNRDAACKDLKKALSLAPEAWRTWHHLITFELSAGLNQEALKKSLEALEKFPENVYLQSDTVKSFLIDQQYQQAAELLDGINVLPYEGASEIHNLFVRTHLNLALNLMLKKDWEKALSEISSSREYPEHLGTGRPFDPDQRIQDYLEAICWKKLGQKDRAGSKLKAILRYTEQFPEGPYAYFGALVLAESGQKTRAAELKARATVPAEFLPLIQKIEK
jgi:tetratricopeptide (TPR) repeat protein